MIEKSDIKRLEALVSIDLDEYEYISCAERINKYISKASKMKLIDTSNVEPTLGSLDNVYDEQVDAKNDDIAMFRNNIGD